MGRNKLSRYLRRKIISCFALELTATQTARLMRINRNTVNRYYRFLREGIARYQDQETARLSAEIKPDSNLSEGGASPAARVRSGAPVYGFLGRQGKVYTCAEPAISAQSLKSIVRQQGGAGCLTLDGNWKRYDGFIFDRYEHVRIVHNEAVADEKQHRNNGIESFWSFYKAKLSKYCGISPKHFHLYLKECEFRFNHRAQSIEPLLLKLFHGTTSTI